MSVDRTDRYIVSAHLPDDTPYTRRLLADEVASAATGYLNSLDPMSSTGKKI